MGNQKVREKKKPTFFLAVLPILAMILLLGVGYAVMGLSPEVLMLVSAAVAAVIAIALGYTWDDIMDSIVGKLSKTMCVIQNSRRKGWRNRIPLYLSGGRENLSSNL